VSTLPLRDYQRECVDAVEQAWVRGRTRPAVVLPTGAGKTVVFAHLIADWGRRNPDRRALVLAHRTELVEQAAGKLRSVAPDTSVGIVKAERNQTLSKVVVASVQTLRAASRRRQLLDVGLVVVDECHHATADSYRTVLAHFGALQPEVCRSPALSVGFTATMTRGDSAALGSIWQEVVYSRSIAEMIAGGWLVRPRGLRVDVEDLDMAGVRRSRGDYAEGDLGRALEASLAPEKIAEAIREHATEAGVTRPTLVFAPTVSSARVIADAVGDAGLSVALVWGGQQDEERAEALRAFQAGEVQVLCNCMVLTEGTDLPLASCVVIARKTLNAGLYIQMVGRVLRPYPGKADALVLDVVGASERHALATMVDLFGDDPDEETERDPCQCGQGATLCACAPRRCFSSCMCGGGKPNGAPCGCPRDDEEALTLEEVGLDDAPDWRSGPLVTQEVDLFHGSSSAWLRTRGGIWFIPTGSRYIAIVPDRDGNWDIVAMHAKVQGVSRWVNRGVPDLSYAMAWAEGDVSPAEHTIAKRERGWKARKPSDKQKDYARGLGIEIQPGMHSGEVSSAIEVIVASRRIDHLVPEHARRILRGQPVGVGA
jgi:superfamily II DNA or RNA helicase